MLKYVAFPESKHRQSLVRKPGSGGIRTNDPQPEPPMIDDFLINEHGPDTDL